MAAALGVSLGALAPAPASAAFPDKPLRLVVGFAAGGSTDIIARVLAPKMEAALGQPVIIENRPGAGGAIAAEAVRKAEPDGQTALLCTTGLFSIQPFLPQPAPFDASQLTPVTVIANTPYIVLVNRSSPAKTFPELVSYAKAHPGELNFASSGNGTASHLAGEMLVQRAGIQIPHVPYKGAGQAMTDLVAGRVSLMFDQLASAMPQIKAGGVRAVAVAGPQRLAALPDVPTTQEAGLADFDPTPWAGLCTSPGVPKDRVATLRQAVLKALSDPDIRQRFEADGMPIVGSTPEEFQAFLVKDRQRWGETVKHIKFE
ncbi:Bug family tripartite tricarboxylate transporter substrate binding protein [Bordetella genomosp. 13]|uniref:Bug family tripartite tricarboxylate transporter substrate binding protein n=1 Tax=Bordetella genomosp. 13 TaxID=463040 RepID=UPI0021B62298|nr:tripartite tricarboxylate transporter substrate binding protein [Bordetella genomosp. 13]